MLYNVHFSLNKSNFKKADSVKLRASEGPGLSDNSKSRPGHKGPEPGKILHLPILSDIGVADLGGGGTRWTSEISPDPHVSVVGIVSGLGPPDPEFGDTLRLPDLSTDIDPGPGESFLRYMLILYCVLCKSLYLLYF